ncbi:hypothetical protein [Paenibacillus massiliensis]|uniref:hypothetical protein n=1 Tax=Paenibacillus massiliensis TaxID=225917 RepID=UPI0004724423|nr:hypothetical protein [Paenibacillus massiliensis]
MDCPLQLDGAEVLQYTTNDGNRILSSVIFEEDDGSTRQVHITALAIATYAPEERYYLFLCDAQWEVINDYLWDSLDEAVEYAVRHYAVEDIDWIGRA